MRKTLRLLRCINEDIAEAKRMIRKLKRENYHGDIQYGDIQYDLKEALDHVGNAFANIEEAHEILSQIYTECYDD